MKDALRLAEFKDVRSVIVPAHGYAYVRFVSAREFLRAREMGDIQICSIDCGDGGRFSFLIINICNHNKTITLADN